MAERRSRGWIFLVVFLAVLAGGIGLGVREFLRESPPIDGGERGGAGAVAEAPRETDAPIATLPAEAPETTLDPSDPAAAARTDLPPMLAGRVVGPSGPVAGAKVSVYPFDVVMRAVRRLEDRVTAESLENVEGLLAIIRAEIVGVASLGVTAVTDEKGEFRFESLREGAYFPLTLASGHVFRVGEPVPVRAGETRELTIRLDAGAQLGGQVVDASGAGLGEVRLTAVFRPPGLVGFGKLIRKLVGYLNGEFLRGPIVARSGPDGRFLFDSLPPGTYDLVAVAGTRPPVTVEAVSTGNLSVLVYLGEGAEVRGSVVRREGGPLEGIRIDLEPDRGTAALPFPGAGVALELMSDLVGDEEPMVAVSDPSGAFEFDNVPPGNYRLRIRERGYVPVERSVAAEKGARADLGRLELDPGESVYGRVVDSRGQPIEGALVSVQPADPGFFLGRGDTGGDLWSERIQARTSADGSFEVAGLTKMKYRILAQASGYAVGTSEPLDPGAGTTITLLPGWSVAGYVSRADTGEPLAGATVSAGGRTSRTDEEGAFQLEGIVPGEPMERFFGGGPRRRETSTRVLVRHPEYVTERVEISRDELASPLAVRMWPRVVVRGEVVGADGTPLPGALVQIVPGEDVPEFLSTLLFFDAGVSDLEGKFELTGGGMDFGEDVRIKASHPLLATGFSEEFKLDKERRSIEGIRVVLVEGGTVEGRVTDGEAPLEGIQVRLGRVRPGDDDPGRQMMRVLGIPPGGVRVYTRGDGTFRFERVSPGAYELEASGVKFADSTTVPVEVASGAITSRELVLDPGGTIEGWVRDTGDRPVAGATVRVMRVVGGEEGRIRRLFKDATVTTRTDDFGAFRAVGLPREPWILEAEKDGYIPAEIEGVIPDGGPVDLVLVPEARLRGTVVDARTGGAIHAFQVSLRDREERAGPEDSLPFGEGQDRWRSVQDSGGRFDFAELRPGAYLVSVRADRYGRAETTVELRAGQTEEVRFELAESGVIRGRVVQAATGVPVAGARVSVRSGGEEEIGPDRATADFVRAFSESTRTDEEGRFEILEIPEYEQVLLVDHPSFVSARRELRLAPGESSDVTIRLDSGFAVSGVARGGDGRPAAGQFLILRGPEGMMKFGGTGPEGGFRFEGLAPGTYRIRSARFGVGGPGESDEEVVLELSEARDDLEVVLPAVPDDPPR